MRPARDGHASRRAVGGVVSQTITEVEAGTARLSPDDLLASTSTSTGAERVM
jgi:hypothetical protein